MDGQNTNATPSETHNNTEDARKNNVAEETISECKGQKDSSQNRDSTTSEAQNSNDPAISSNSELSINEFAVAPKSDTALDNGKIEENEEVEKYITPLDSGTKCDTEVAETKLDPGKDAKPTENVGDTSPRDSAAEPESKEGTNVNEKITDEKGSTAETDGVTAFIESNAIPTSIAQNCDKEEMEKVIDDEKTCDLDATKNLSAIVKDSSDERKTDEVCADRTFVTEETSVESKNLVENEVTFERTTEIIEFVEYTSVDKTEESTTASSELFEIVVEPSDEGNENGIEVAEPETAARETTNDAALVTVFKGTTIDQANGDEEKRSSKDAEIVAEKPSMQERKENGKTVTPEVMTVSKIPDVSREETKVTTAAESSQSPAKQRSVIEDIFDDWQDENPEDDSCQQHSKSDDSVEMKLKILLHDDKSMDETCATKITRKSVDGVEATEMNMVKCENAKSSEEASNESQLIGENLKSVVSQKKHEDIDKSDKEISSTAGQTITVKSLKTEKNEIPVGRERLIKQKPLAPRPGVKVPRILLTSPIVSKSAVSKVLKERIREQQKEFDSPTKPDIFFVKKITQRLSHKLAAASAAQVPGLLPIPQISKSSTTVDGKKSSSGVDKELLAILEGDVDPDWSNLKGPNIVENASKCSSHGTVERNASAKMDPLVEREMALKQLLELPSSPTKKVTMKKNAAKPVRNKTAKVTSAKAALHRNYEDKAIPEDTKNVLNHESIVKEDSMDSSQSLQEYKNDETRSGRKRKPTEKAREHENSTKRLKVLKSRTGGSKRSSQENDHSPAIESSIVVKNEVIDISSTTNSGGQDEATSDEAMKKENEAAPGDSVDSYGDEAKRKFVESKKVPAKPSAKRKISAGQKLMRQKISSNKKSSLGLKGRFPKGIAKKMGTKLKGGKGQKRQRNNDNSNVEVKPKKKPINEIDRLLQDEGVVNLLYDVEQPDKKRLVPITKSQTKVMDLQKIQRELKIRTKLVRNAVLRLRTSSNITTNKVSPRLKRSISHSSDIQAEKRNSEAKIVRSTSPSDNFIYPAKIRNAADASIIIRRHSSSSFSSASASPRASIDAPERLSIDGGKLDESSGGIASHVLRSNKRRLSIEDDKKKKKAKSTPEPKRNRRKINDRTDTETNILEDEHFPVDKVGTKNKSGNSSSVDVPVPIPDIPVSTSIKSKKIEGKKSQRASKQHHRVNIGVSRGGSSGKIATRSNGPTGEGRFMPKSKKSIKCKVTFAKGSESVNKKIDSPGQQDELSACLAEAVTALSNDSGGSSRSRSNIPVNRNKNKGNSSNLVKSFDVDEKQIKTEPRVQFSNNEIVVQRHGKLVQLILTPSTSTKIRNGITLQVMQEIRENLSILKKDEDCRVVLLTSTGTSFCEGLVLSNLLHNDKDVRRLRAEELANGVKEFIKSLATFNKPIVAGVQGTAIGLGVTMLPWFDLVIASDKATFNTPYGKLGQIAEGAAIFTLSHILGSAVTSELLLGGRTLTANEALRAGLVTRVLWPDRFQDELLPSLRAMSEQSSQSMEATKALLRHSLRKKLDAALESESYLLVQHWCSAECQAAITAYVDDKIQ